MPGVHEGRTEGPAYRTAPAASESAGWPCATMGAVTDTFYDRVGGHETFVRLVDHFYAGVASDPPLRALYPEEDLGPAADRLRLFLEQYWGGPHTYSETRGHPRLRLRHLPFAVTPTQRDRWVHHMMGAVDALGLPAAEDGELREYLVRAAQFMVNAGDPPGSALGRGTDPDR